MAIFLGKRTADLAALQERQALLAGLEKEQTDRQQARDAHKKQRRQEREQGGRRGRNEQGEMAAEQAAEAAAEKAAAEKATYGIGQAPTHTAGAIHSQCSCSTRNVLSNPL